MNQPETTRENGTPGDQPVAERTQRRDRLLLPRRFVWGLPLGWQLGALYAVLLMLTLSLVGVLVYSQQKAFLAHDAADRLVLQARDIAAMPQQAPRSEQDQGPAGSGTQGDEDQSDPGHSPHNLDSESSQDHLVQNLVRGLTGPGVTVAVLDTAGSVITSTQALGGGSAPAVQRATAEQVSQALSTHQPVEWTVTGKDATRHVVVLMAITQQVPASSGGQDAQKDGQPGQGGTVTLLVEQAASLAAVDAGLSSLGLLLLLGVLGGTVVGVVLVLAFTSVVLRPLDRVADTADAIAQGNLQRRLNLPLGRSEVARLGKAFDYMVSRLVATLESQRRFVADASHELRTPLTSLKGLAEILVIGAHGGDTRVIEQSARAINSELERLIRLVTDLLTLSRLDNTDGNSPPPGTRRSPMELCTTIEAAVHQMAGLAEARGVQLTQECTGEIRVLGDSGQIKQVLLNLIDNALRHTPGGGKIAVTGSEQAGAATLQVRDTGSGIAEKDLAHIFERFYRGDTSRTRATGNSGLGLAIAQTIVEAHGGSIEVESAIGQGSCFTVHLPLLLATRAERERAAPVSP